MSDLSSSDVEIIKEIKKKKPQSSSVPEQDTPSPDDVDSPDDFEMDDAPSVNVSEKENEEEEEKKEKKQIKEIINHKVNSRGKIQYMVKYKGKYPNEWVDEEDLIDNSDLIAEYMKSETSKPPKEEKIDLTNMKFDIIGAFKKNDKIYYQLHYENNETTLISAKKMHALDSAKLIKFLENYCIKEHKIEKT